MIDKIEDFGNTIQPKSILPECYGGDESMNVLIGSVKTTLDSDRTRWILQKMHETQIDWDKVPQNKWTKWFASFF